MWYMHEKVPEPHVFSGKCEAKAISGDTVHALFRRCPGEPSANLVKAPWNAKERPGWPVLTKTH